MVVTEPAWVSRFVDWLCKPRGKTVREGGLSHELNQRQPPSEIIDDVAEKIREKTKGYRDG
jgi:hypothetical protein